ncbi:MAG: hypothetical protein ABIV28_07515 [Longimicrobiales bacterium]
MTSNARTLVWTCVLALAGCAPATMGSMPIAPDAPARDAASLRHRCVTAPEAARMDCFDKGLLATMRQKGIPTALSMLDTLSAIDADVKRDGHMYAHSMGLAAYTGPAQLTATFRQCLPIFQSGCYHGVIQAYFSEIAGTAGIDGVTADAVNKVCGDYRASPEGNWLLFQCVHGMGHGLSQVSGHDLKRTLTGCDKLESPWEREGCYGGAFMENATEAFAPHHTVGRPTAEKMDHSAMGSMAGMDHGASPATVKLIDPTDPLYPCSMLDDRYLTSCYMMQTSVMLALTHGDFADAARNCDKISTKYRTVCYQSMGRDVSAYTQQDFTRAAARCSIGDPLYQPWCHNGFVKNVIDVTADYRSGVPYCRTLARADDKSMCYRAIGEELVVLMPADAARAIACGDVETSFRETCLLGARVPLPKREPTTIRLLLRD